MPELPADVTRRVFFDISINGAHVGRVVMGLYGDIVPKTVENFASLCKGVEVNGRHIGYKGKCTSLIRVI